jgi:hypothetical protein
MVVAGCLTAALLIAFIGSGPALAAPPTSESGIGLPFAINESAKFNAGPHHNVAPHSCATHSPPCNSLDFLPSSGLIRAAAAGMVHFPFCGTNHHLVVIDHGNGWVTGYYHMPNAQGQFVSDGQMVSAGTIIGEAGTDTSCGGSGGTSHVHFAVKYIPGCVGATPQSECAYKKLGDPFQNTNVDVDLEGETLGGWHITGNDQNSCMTYLATGEKRCVGDQVTNYGGAPLEITTKELPLGTPGREYTASLKATGGSGGYTWSLSSGVLQAGLSLGPSGTISGTPKQADARSVTVKVTDSQGHSQSAPLVLRVGAPHQELFARASDGSVWHDYFIPGSGSWSGWGSLEGATGATLQSDVSVGYNTSGSEEQFTRASDGSVWHDFFILGSSSWSGWGSLGGASAATLQSDVSVGYNAGGSEELFARTSDGTVSHDFFIAGSSSWSGWGSLGGAAGVTLQSNVAVGYNASGNEELFARASDGSVWHDYFIPGSSSWSGWGTLGAPTGATLQSDVSVGYNAGGSEELFARASDGSIWHDYFIPGTSSWSGWGSLGGASGVTLRSDVSVGYNQSGSEELFARASDGSVWHDYFIPGSSSWSGWGSLGGASGVALRSDVSTAESATPQSAMQAAPSATTGAAAAVSPVSEELAGSVNPNGEAVSECRFEYGSTTAYGLSVPCSASLGEGESPVAVWAVIAGLTPSTVYHFRTVATNATGTSYGGDQTFTTLSLTASESTNRGSSQNGGARSGPTPSHSVLAGKTRRSASRLWRALAKCHKVKNRRKRARCIARAKKHYGPKHSSRAKGRR